MNLRDVKYLIAVAETRHFGRAAERCFVSQPTLSGQIKKLEDELGVTVFERTNRSVTVTPIGERILTHARLLLEQASVIQQLARAHRDAQVTRADERDDPDRADRFLGADGLCDHGRPRRRDAPGAARHSLPAVDPRDDRHSGGGRPETITRRSNVGLLARIHGLSIFSSTSRSASAQSWASNPGAKLRFTAL